MAESPIPHARAAARIRALRMALLDLHKAILDTERARYERVHGRIGSPHEALRLVMNDPWFAWIRPMAELIVQSDTRLADPEPLTSADASRFRTQVIGLVQGDGGGATFRD